MNNVFSSIWTILGDAERKRVLPVFVLVIAMAFMESIGVLSVVPFLTALTEPESLSSNFFIRRFSAVVGADDSRKTLMSLGVASIIAVTISALFKAFTLYKINRLIAQIRNSISTRLFSAYLNKEYEFFLTRNSTLLSKNVISEVDQLQANLVQPMAQVIAQCFIVGAMACLMLVYNPGLAVSAILLALILYASIYALVRKRIKRIGTERLNANGARHKICQEALAGIKEVKISGSANHFRDEFSAASGTFALRVASSETMAQAPLYFVEAIGYTILIGAALLLVGSGSPSALPTLGVFGFAAYKLLPAFQIIYRGLAKLRFSGTTLRSLAKDLCTLDSEGEIQYEPFSPSVSVDLSSVTFYYPGRSDVPVFKEFDFSIPINSIVGISGPSGSGKSTLMDLLLGLLAPQSGLLSVDGIPITKANVHRWHQTIGYVPQEIHLSDATIAENIALGESMDRLDMNRVKRAAKEAQASAFIEALPEAYAARVGDRGNQLSGGQRQRIAIARALYRDPAVIFFDEATSALDNETVEAINSAIEALSSRKTIIIIAHQENALTKCDHVFRL